MLPVRLIGAVLIVSSSGWVGLHAAASLRRMTRSLEEFHAALEWMRSELSFTGIPYPELCRQMEGRAKGPVSAFFHALSEDAAGETFSPVGATNRALHAAHLSLPPAAFCALEQLFDGFGRFDLSGQIRQIELASEAVSRQADALRGQVDSRCRVYEMLGICTGIAVMILVI